MNHGQSIDEATKDILEFFLKKLPKESPDRWYIYTNDGKDSVDFFGQTAEEVINKLLKNES